MKKVIFILLLLVPVVGDGQVITTVAGSGTGPASGDGGAATSANIGRCSGLAIDFAGNIYILSGFEYRVRRVDAITGIITTVAGTGVSGYNGDGIQATAAQLSTAAYIAVDSASNLFISDNDRIRRINLSTGVITTIAGTGTAGYSGDGGQATAAQINDNTGIAVDWMGNLYFGDSGNNRIRKVDLISGIISTIAGTGVSSSTGDGGMATNATVRFMMGICTDYSGNIYITNDSGSIREINVTTGIITRVAGKGDGIGTPYLGDGLPATNQNIGGNGVAVDRLGNIFISDGGGNSRIEKVNTAGIISTVAGTGVQGFSGDGGIATAAKVDHPENVAIDRCNNVYIADFSNYRVRKVTFNPPPCISLNSGEQVIPADITIYPNPASSLLHIDNIKPNTTYQLLSIVGAVMLNGNLNEGCNTISMQHLPPGMYLLHLTTGAGERMVRRVVKE